MFKVHASTGVIVFSDGFELAPPYDHPRYLEYAAWVVAGNTAEEIESSSMLAADDIEVEPYQARAALDSLGLYDVVLALMAHKDTPRTIKIKWEFTLAFRRNDATVIQMAEILGWNADLLDSIFALAKTLK